MATLMDWLMQRQARGYESPAAPSLSDIVTQRQNRGYTMPPAVNVPNPMAPNEAVHEQLLRQVGAVPDAPIQGGANVTARPAYSQMQTYVGGQDSPLEQLRMRGQAGFPSPTTPPIPAAPLMPFSPNQFGGLNLAPAAAAAAVQPPRPIQSATATEAPKPSDPGFWSKIFSGQDYQSNSMPTIMTPQGPTDTGAVMPQSVNWGDPNNSADYFRAAAAAQRLGLL